MGAPLRVLIIEDSIDDMTLTVDELERHGYELIYTRVETAAAMNDALDQHKWDVILSDYSMPRFSAIDALKVVHDRNLEIPFIIISGTVGEETAVTAMKAGAHDFFAKDKLMRLVPAIERELREAQERRRRRWAEEQLRQSEERFAKAFQAGPMAVSITSDNEIFIEVNDAFLQLTGYNQGELIGHTATELGLWVDFEARDSLSRAVVEGQPVRDMELQFRTKSGEVRDALFSFTTIDLAGQTCVLSMIHDITERKRMEWERARLLEQKQAATQEFLDTLERITEGFAILDWQSNFVFVNPKASELLRRASADLIGRNVWAVFPEAVDSPFYHAIHDAFARQVSMEIEAFFEPWGRWFVTRMYPTLDGVTTFFQDVTERKRQEREALESERLRVEIEKERELIQLKEQFISIVSHEFRTPLTAITSSAELIQRYYDRLTPERHLYHVQDILSQSKFMIDLLDDVLTVNKGRAARIEFNPVPMDVLAFCTSIVERLRVQDNGLHAFIVQTEGDLSQVVMDARLWQHIVVNLLTNAVKYSPGGGDIHLNVARQGSEVVCRVSDHGIGIPPEALPRLYEPFQRASNVGTINGSGLGLAIVKQSVDRHGGTITCESKLGEGTTFTVRLPEALK